jgi:hypothetical protein
MVLSQCLHTLDVSLRLTAYNWRAVSAVPHLRALSRSAGIKQQSLPQRLLLHPVAAQSRHVWASSVLSRPMGEHNRQTAHFCIVRATEQCMIS